MRHGRKVMAIVGFGGMGAQHAKLLQTVEQVMLKGVWDIDSQRRNAAESEGLIAYTGIDALLGDPEVDIVLIATPNDTHRLLAIQALEAGKNVICEKPVTLNSAELEQILAVTERTGKHFSVHQNRRWDEDYLTIKGICSSGLIGEVFHVETRVHGSRGIPGDWRKRREQGGGMLLDWGVHLLDRLLLMMPGTIDRVYCQLSYALGAEVDDGFILQLTFQDGRTALVDVSTCNYIALPKWVACGKKGTAVINDWEMNGKVVVLNVEGGPDAKPIVAGAGLTKTMAGRNDGTSIELPLPVIHADVRDFYRNFIEAMDGKAEPAVKNEQALRVMRLIDAVFKSGHTGKSVVFGQ